MKKSVVFLFVLLLLIVSIFSICLAYTQDDSANGAAGAEEEISNEAESAAEPVAELATESAVTEDTGNLVESIKSQCDKNSETCSCSPITDTEAKEGCEANREEGLQIRREAMKKAEEFKEKIKVECIQNPFSASCNCNEIEDAEGKAECETAILQGKYEADAEKQKIIKECVSNLEICNCGQIKNEKAKAECEAEKEKGIVLKKKIKEACEKDLGACSCIEIENEEGRKECENAREKAQNEAGAQVISTLNKCFKNVDACKCDELELPNQEYVDFCEVEKNYGISCRDKGLYCEELETMPLMPYGLPRFLEPIFKITYKNLIENEKSKGAAKGAAIMKDCILNPEKCDCNIVPPYATTFCEQQKALQIRCLADDYEACMILEKNPNLPQGMPPFSVGIFERIAEGARKMQEGIVKTNAARKVGNTILSCMDSSDKCDCTIAPKGNWRAFCEHKKELIYKCRTFKDYDSCFILDEEPVITEDMPGFIKSYINKNIVPKVEEKKKDIYDEMKLGTVCADISELKECKAVYNTKNNLNHNL